MTEYFKTVFLEIPLGVNLADFCLEGHIHLYSPANVANVAPIIAITHLRLTKYVAM